MNRVQPTAADELVLRYWRDPSFSAPHFEVVKNERGAIVHITGTKEAAEEWAAVRNSRGRGSVVIFGESVVKRVAHEQDHMADAFRYLVLIPPPQPRHLPGPVHYWLALRRWISSRLQDLADWVRP